MEVASALDRNGWEIPENLDRPDDGCQVYDFNPGGGYHIHLRLFEWPDGYTNIVQLPGGETPLRATYSNLDDAMDAAEEFAEKRAIGLLDRAAKDAKEAGEVLAVCLASPRSRL